jgi:hypothetical protein
MRKKIMRPWKKASKHRICFKISTLLANKMYLFRVKSICRSESHEDNEAVIVMSEDGLADITIRKMSSLISKCRH